jgi:predicted AAA+ superfamily ATPase
MGKIIERPLYIKRFQPFIDKSLIKIIVGQRRVGKSYILRQLSNVISERNTSANIIFIDKERNEFDFINNYQVLGEFVRGKCLDDVPNYLFIDEVQEIENFEKSLRSLLNEGGVDIYCTGSNADLLSGELATLLSGRHIEFRVNALSYNEFLSFHQVENNNSNLMKYLRFGGLPFLIHLEMDEILVYDYLKNIYSTILFKDVVKRYKIRNISFLESLVTFLAGSIGSLVSAKKISDFLISQKVQISPRIVLEYLSYLNKAYLVNKAVRFDIVGKKVFETGDKRFFEDIGIRNAIVGYKQADVGKVMENVVYNHLIQCGYKVSVGIFNAREVDFVCQKRNETIYVQVAYLITDEKTAMREYGNLLKIKDNYPKYVVSMDEFQGNTYEGIRHLHLREFLTSDIFGG